MLARTAKRTAKHILDMALAPFDRSLVIVDRSKPHYHLFDSNMLSAYWNNEEAVATYENSLNRTGMAWSDNLSKRCRYYSLYQNTALALERNLGKGDVAECGVWRGHSAHMIATILQSRGFTDRFLIFDSFEGLSDLSQQDQNERYVLNQKQTEEQREILACSEDVVRGNLAEFDFLDFYPGWIPTRFPEVADRRFILVHVDVDLYKPYHDCIEFFFPRLVEGGVMVFDDYGLTQFPGAKTAVDQLLDSLCPSFFYKIPTGGAFFIK